ncbi:MAG: phytanoyl-CoA dioxygenase family protein [candidate division Zixibacteria bacterium]|nr:phytanoyl-CoA dioxygenase family protein [candidate division Zixibacteria bacterium]
MPRLTPSQLQSFEERGYVVIPSFFNSASVQNAREEVTLLVDRHIRGLMAEGKVGEAFEDELFETRLVALYRTVPDQMPRIFRRELHLAGMFDLFFHPGLLDIVEQLLGGEIRLYPNYSVRPKLPDHAPTLVLWHQDGGYTQNWHLDAGHCEKAIETLRMVNVWFPLVPARERNGCMQFIPGTHRLGLVPHEGREFYLEISKEVLEPFLPNAVSIEVDPGDLVLFHNMLFHQGLPNRSDQVRWSMDWRYQDATQSTLRTATGHIARSRLHPEQVVADAVQWTQLSFQ